MADHRVSFVFPAYNESGNIERAVRAAIEAGERFCAEHEVVVVDDGSLDDTAAIVHRIAEQAPQVRLIQHPTNRGYGGALRSGFLAAKLDLVFLTDSDNQFDLAELERFLELIELADVVVGHRVQRADPFMRRANGVAWNLLMRSLFHTPVQDVDCAFKLFRLDVLDEVELESTGAMVSAELMVKLAASGRRIVEVAVSHYPRTAGTPGGASPRVIARAFRELARMHRPLTQLQAEAAQRRRV